MKRRMRVGLFAVALGVAGCGTPASAPGPITAGQAASPAQYDLLAQGHLPGLQPPHSAPHGMSYADWNAAWWTWALTLPWEGHPLRAEGEVDLAAGQSGNVWFLGGAFGSSNVEREGTIPSGTSLFFPLVNTSYTEDERVARSFDLADWRALVGTFEASTLSLTIDGRTSSVEELQSFYSESPVFALPLAEGSINDEFCRDLADPPSVGLCWALDTTDLLGFGVGYYVFLPPLSVGEHTISFSAGVGGNVQNVTYHLTVVPRGQ